MEVYSYDLPPSVPVSSVFPRCPTLADTSANSNLVAHSSILIFLKSRIEKLVTILAPKLNKWVETSSELILRS